MVDSDGLLLFKTFRALEAADEELFRLQYKIRNTDLPKNTRDATKILSQIITKEIRMNQRQIERRTCLLQRYKREAMSKQRKAQRAWCDQFKKD